MNHNTDHAVHFDSIAVQLRDIGDSLAQLGRITDPAALRDDVRAAYREFADRLAAWREQVAAGIPATVTTTDTEPCSELAVALAQNVIAEGE